MSTRYLTVDATSGGLNMAIVAPPKVAKSHDEAVSA